VDVSDNGDPRWLFAAFGASLGLWVLAGVLVWIGWRFAL
jgi:hypothetical protein